MDRLMHFLLIASFLVFPFFTVYAQEKVVKPVFTEARVEKIFTKDKKKTVTVKVTAGALKGKMFTVIVDVSSRDLNYNKGENVLISYENSKGKEQVYIVDYVRNKELFLLLFVFVSLVFFIGRRKGITSFIGMILSFFVIGTFIIPNIVLGNDPLLVSLLGSLFIIPITFYLSHGFNKKTSVAIAGTFFSLVVTGLLAYFFTTLTRLTGLASEEAAFLQAFGSNIVNIKNLLLAGIIIGAMGVLDDITIAQAAVVERLSIANPRYTTRELFTHGMEVGRDHIASLVNTLILVYTGASLPLFLLFYNTNMSYVMVTNQEIVTTEIVRTLVSSIGIVLAVPLTTILASWQLKK